MSPREQPLTIEIIDGRVVISIGIDALMTAAAAGDDFVDDELVITDADAFAASIVFGLEDEMEDGTTGIHLAIDKAVEWAIEYGEPGAHRMSDPDGDEDA